MSIYQPFTYLIKFIPTGQVYYGVRTKQRCHPSELWTTYFTSSKTVHRLIEQYGVDSFEVSIRKCFESKQDAILWEHRVLTKFNAAKNKQWLNKNNGSRKFIPHDKHTNETKQKIGNAHRGKVMSNTAKQKMRTTRIERFSGTLPWHSNEANNKRSETLKGREPWNKGKTMSYKGRTSPTKGLRWYNNGVDQFLVKECPPGCVRGKLR